eukprot:TRINITY_DN4462_c0_g1_i1.p1 TRINITY_DN4462_c0_g1~~TRINITY_DN4462_c0_g1_i1.p1  ORF type:complete len:241 (-),score=58.89 TRINITY_DN4462_c0_g1_i1:215-937(-)
MGNDGGSIPRRDELCKLKKEKGKADPQELKYAKWHLCKLSQEPLRPPIVACRLGFLYNKEAVIQSLLKKTIPQELNHISKLKDVVEIHLERNAKSADTWICPITQRELSGQHRAICLKTCGHVMLDQALREISSAQCLVCGVPFIPKDVWTLNGPEEEVKKLQEQLETEKAAERKAKKEKDKDKEKRTSASTSETAKADAAKRMRHSDEASTRGHAPPQHSNPDVYFSLFLSKDKAGPSS